MYKVFEDVIPEEVLLKIQFLFETEKSFDNRAYSKRLKKPWNLTKSFLEPILSKFFDCSNNGDDGGNIYSHHEGYLLHTDCEFKFPIINCNIPVVSEEDQKLIIFEQYTNYGTTKTWSPWNLETKLDEYNQRLLLKPSEDKDIIGLVDKDCNVYDDYMDEYNHGPKDFYYGLSGKAVDWKPGNLILFDSNHLHITGTMKSNNKLGCLLNFNGKLNEILKNNYS